MLAPRETQTSPENLSDTSSGKTRRRSDGALRSARNSLRPAAALSQEAGRPPLRTGSHRAPAGGSSAGPRLREADVRRGGCGQRGAEEEEGAAEDSAGQPQPCCCSAVLSYLRPHPRHPKTAPFRAR